MVQFEPTVQPGLFQACVCVCVFQETKSGFPKERPPHILPNILALISVARAVLSPLKKNCKCIRFSASARVAPRWADVGPLCPKPPN